MSNRVEKPKLSVADELRRVVDESISALKSTMADLKTVRAEFPGPSDKPQNQP